MWIDNNDKIMEVIDNIEVGKPECFPVICPVCGKKEAHLYFHRHGDDEKGGIWTWCSYCKHYAHAIFRLPEWWINPGMIKFEELSSCPDVLEKEKKIVDEWINELLTQKSSVCKD